MRRIIQSKIFYLLLILIVAFPIKSFAQYAKWYKENDRGNRYEGRRNIPSGKSGDIDLLSFVGFCEAFDSSVILKVRFYLPKALPVFISGRELQEEKQYLMEAKPNSWQVKSWNEFAPWPTRDVIDNENIPSWNLGVLIQLTKFKTDVSEIAPAFVYYTKLPESVSAYTLYLRPNSTLISVNYTLYKIIRSIYSRL